MGRWMGGKYNLGNCLNMLEFLLGDRFYKYLQLQEVGVQVLDLYYGEILVFVFFYLVCVMLKFIIIQLVIIWNLQVLEIKFYYNFL